ncbi:polymorphic toxin type 44 domain-containing protein [Alkaliphilus pronyensis]|uniref:polymorphic toxin type 44 domain-containing protein n=1 Tax=Alkaliphilus pronyensis TaxID=1482732 RepID=UPI0018657EA6|nr:polymorphic toxin type 44 domain-containing protein [Alkaliphilus pronyensis]
MCFYNKKFTAKTFNGIEVVTSEYIGNYNYGFTGEMIFSLSILYTGGEFAGGHLFTPEGMDDRSAIEAGHDDAVDNW